MAAATMSMNKVIHGAVRRDLARFRSALDAFRDGDRDRAAALHRAWQNFDAQLTEHHEGEHEIAFPAMRAVGIDPGTVESFDSEHEVMARNLATARAAMATLRTTTENHLAHEEAETESTFVREDDPVIKEMGRKFGRRVGPPRAGVFFAWVQDGASAEELAALRHSVPGPVLAILGGVFGRSYRRDIAPVWR